MSREAVIAGLPVPVYYSETGAREALVGTAYFRETTVQGIDAFAARRRLMGAIYRQFFWHNPAPTFSPVSLFASGETGGYWDFTDASSLYFDTVGGTLATAGGVVSAVADKSGNARHISGGSGVTRQTGYTAFAGTGGLTTAAGATGAAAGFTVYSAFRPTAVTANQAAIDADYQASNSTRIAQPLLVTAAAAQSLAFDTGQTTSSTASSTGNFTAGADYVFGVSVSPTAHVTRLNKTQIASTTRTQNPASSASGIIGVGVASWGSGSFSTGQFTGRKYASFWINRVLTTAERDDLENWLYARAGL